MDNRTVGIRSPVSSEGAAGREPGDRRGREPYVALAATLACGYLGIENRINPTEECKGNAYQAPELPRSLSEAVSLLRAEHDLRMFSARSS